MLTAHNGVVLGSSPSGPTNLLEDRDVYKKNN